MTVAIPSLGAAERKLLLTCSRLQLDDEQTERARELLGVDLDWGALLFYSRLHSVAPLLYQSLETLGGLSAVPDGPRVRLLQLRHRAEYQNRIFTEENDALIDAFEEADVQVLVPKGLPLVELVYGSLARRPLIDLVFLARPEATGAAQQVLHEQSYQESKLRPSEQLYRWCCPQIWFVRKKPMHLAAVVNSNLVNWPRVHRFDHESVWRAAETVRLGNRSVQVLSPQHLILYLCLVADNTGFFNRVALDELSADDLLFAPYTNNRLIRFTDIHAVARHYEDRIDWDGLSSNAKAFGIEHAVAGSLRLTRELVGPGPADRAVLEPGPGNTQRMRRLLFDFLREERPTGLKARLRHLWKRSPEGRHLRWIRLLGFVEYTFPPPSRLVGSDSSALSRAVAFVKHSGYAWLRGGAEFVSGLMRRVAGGLGR